MDFRYSVFDTPIGVAVAVVSPQGLVTLDFADTDELVGASLRSAAERLRAAPSSDTDATESWNTPLPRVGVELDEYFDGERHAFDLALDLRLVRGVTRAALEATCTIPYGQTASYGEVAVLAGAPRAARAVGTACATTPISLVIPVHRVVRADGSIGEYGGRPQIKRWLLDLEADRA